MSAVLQESDLKFENLVRDHLFATGYVSDVAFLSKTGNCIYSSGKDLESSKAFITSENIKKLFKLVNSPETTVNMDICGDTITFRVFHQTLCSVYATCDGGLHTLVVCDSPVGVLACLSSAPVIANQMIPVVENVADKLRA